MTLIMCLAAAAYVVVKSVDAGVSFTRGLYSTYAGGSSFSDMLYLYEVLAILSWQFWSLIVIIIAFVSASDIWTKLDARLAEAAAASIGLENPLTWTMAVKTSALLMVCTFGVVVTAYALSDTADELISYFGEYDDNTKTEGDQKTDASADDPDGTSAQWDVGISHMITTFYAYAVFAAISIGGYIFYTSFSPLEDNVVCDFEQTPPGTYTGINDLLG